ncbi:hypothetical protein BJY01DRAFT_236001 [Aspergillus pseudoustus]|uniref:HAD-like domain-containing protein n=1 Tax=Aspergillus pseudoustus TaxID=1810923 RepID=A0ABR4JQU1_9EURO
MAQLSEYRLLSFDVYGTLVDWEGGILAAFQPMLDKANAQFTRRQLLTAYHDLEREQQNKTPYMAYSQLLTTIHPQLTAQLGLAVPTPEESKQFGESIGTWPAFPDTVHALKRLSRQYKLAVLSNVDRESFAKTNAGSLEGFPFDLIITAQDVGSYKPDLRNFDHMLTAVKEKFDIDPSQVLQTAQSQFHDHHPAHKVGLKSVWIERPGATMGNLSENIYDWKFDTLGDMADALEREQVAVTYTADQYQGIYRGKKYHDPDWAEVIKRAHAYNCPKMMLTTMTLPGAYQNLEACRQYPETCTMTLGVHPYHVGDIYASEDQEEKSYLERLKRFGQELIKEERSPLVAFGEIGLDYARLELAEKQTQQRAFREQLELAVEFQLPLFLHARDACADFIEILTPYLPRLPRGGLVHSFAGTKDEMLQLVDLGLDISVNGVCFRTDEQLEMVRAIPLDRLQLETDAPWCEIVVDERIAGFLEGAPAIPPSRKHGKFVSGQMVKGRNESCTIESVARVTAGLIGVSVEEVAEKAWANSVRMFGLGVDRI